MFIIQTQKRHWTQELSNPRPDLRIHAEEILDARIIKSASRPANPRPNAEEILDAGIIKSASRPARSAFCKPRLMRFKYLDSGARPQEPAPDVAERKDQSPRLNPSQLEIFSSEGSKMQDLMAPGHQTRASVINPKTASGNQTRFKFVC